MLLCRTIKLPKYHPIAERNEKSGFDQRKDFQPEIIIFSRYGLRNEAMCAGMGRLDLHMVDGCFRNRT